MLDTKLIADKLIDLKRIDEELKSVFLVTRYDTGTVTYDFKHISVSLEDRLVIIKHLIDTISEDDKDKLIAAIQRSFKEEKRNHLQVVRQFN